MDQDEFYLYRVEELIYFKYAPELIDEFHISFSRARARREQVLKSDSNIIMTKEQFIAQMQSDLQTYVPWKPKNSTHKRTSAPRPGIGQFYQQEFREL